MAAYWGIAAHSAYDMFSLYNYLNVILVFPTPRFMEWEFLSDYVIPDHCLLLPFHANESHVSVMNCLRMPRPTIRINKFKCTEFNSGKEIPWILSTMINKLMLSRLLIPLLPR